MKLEKIYQISKREINYSIRLIKGDITDQNTDAIVNAANEELILGAGVAGSIKRKGGPTIQEECNFLGRTPTGTAQITSGGNLKTKYIIHAVGPIYQQYSSPKANSLLFDVVLNSLLKLRELDLSSITFPAISTGIYGFPKEMAAKTMIEAINRFFNTAETNYLIQICLFSEKDFQIFLETADIYYS